MRQRSASSLVFPAACACQEPTWHRTQPLLDSDTPLPRLRVRPRRKSGVANIGSVHFQAWSVRGRCRPPTFKGRVQRFRPEGVVERDARRLNSSGPSGTSALPNASQDPTTGRVPAERTPSCACSSLTAWHLVERELPSAKPSGQAGRALSAQAACTADTKRHWRCSGGDGSTWSAVRDESWSPWSERAPVRSVAVVVIGEPLTVVVMESVGRSNRRGTRGYSAA